MDEDKQHKINVSYAVCRSCTWIMHITQDALFQCRNPNCVDVLKLFQARFTVVEVPSDQAEQRSIPGVVNG